MNKKQMEKIADKFIEKKCKICPKKCMKFYPYIRGKDEKQYKRNLFGIKEEYNLTTNNKCCADCGTLQGEYHHENCDIERCPICKNQMLSCDCWTHYELE